MLQFSVILILAVVADAVSSASEDAVVAQADYKLLQRQLAAKQESLDKIESRYLACKDELEGYTEEENKYEHHLGDLMKDMETLGLYSSKLKGQLGEKNEHIAKLEAALTKAGLEVPQQKVSSGKGDVASCADQKLQVEKELLSYRNRNHMLEENAKLFGQALTQCNDTVKAKNSTILELEQAKEKLKEECDATISDRQRALDDMKEQLNNVDCKEDEATKNIQEALDKTKRDFAGAKGEVASCTDQKLKVEKELSSYRDRNTNLEENAKRLEDTLTKCDDTVKAKDNTILDLEKAKENIKGECDAAISNKQRELDDNVNCKEDEDETAKKTEEAKKVQEAIDKTKKDLAEAEETLKVCAWAEHDGVIKWKHFPRYWPFVRGIHRSPVSSPHKGQWRGALIFSLICAWITVE